MERSNPEVKLALAAERRLRRPAGALRALLAAAGREALAEAPLNNLLAEPDLTLLAALLEAPAAGAAGTRTARRNRRLPQEPGAAMRGGTARPANAPEGEGRRTAALRPLGEVGAPRPAMVSDDAPPTAPILPLSANVHDAARPGLAQRRAALRRSLIAAPSVPAAASPLLQPGESPPEHHAREARLQPPSVARHALIAAATQQAVTVALARAAEGAARAGAAEASVAPLSCAAPEAAGPAMAQHLRGGADLPAAPAAHAPSAPLSPLFRDAVAVGTPATIPAPRPRSHAPFTLDDDALAEAAWRNGVDLP